jgi:hypothetical protein
MLKQHEDMLPRNEGQPSLGMGGGGESRPCDGPEEAKYGQEQETWEPCQLYILEKATPRIDGSFRRNRSQTCHGFKVLSSEK